MCLELLKRDNLIKAWNAYFAENAQDLYPTIIGYNQQAVDEYNHIAEKDWEKQYSFVKETCEDTRFGFGNFKQGGSPVNGYNDPQNQFCHAMSKDYQVENTAHRLYFNLGDKRIEFLRTLTIVCTERNIPFYFKWSKNGARADNVVVYIDNEHLNAICEAINDIAVLNPTITKSDRDKPMSTEDCGWFGYGVEEGDHRQSFSRKVSNSLFKTFDQIRAAYNYDTNAICSVISDPELSEQFVDYMRAMATQQFAADHIPSDLSYQMPQAIKNLANLKDLQQSKEM